MSTVAKKIMMGSGATASAYEIDQSLIMNDASYTDLYRVPSSTGNRRTFTWSGWIKRSDLTGNQIWGTDNGDGTYFSQMSFRTDGKLDWTDYFYTSASPSVQGRLRTNRLFRDVGAWYHIVFAVDTTQTTASNRFKLWINGVQETSFEIATYPSENLELYQNYANGYKTHVGNAYADIGGVGYGIKGQIAELHFFDGAAKTPSDFGETNSDTGQWIPKKYSGGSYGTNGYYLKFVSGAIGTDSSGEGNNMTVTNLANADVVTDTPTNNFCTLNPLASAATFSQGNSIATTGTNANRGVVGTMAIPASGKWYWECKPTDEGAGLGVGVGNKSNYLAHANNFLGNLSGTYMWATQQSNTQGYKYVNGSGSTVSQNFTNNDVIGVAFNIDAGTLTMYKNGSSQLEIASGLSGQFQPIFSDFGASDTSTFEANFGQKSFAHTPPSGHVALSTANLPAPAISLPSAHFNTVLYTGNDADGRTISGVGFQPDFVWQKARNATNYNWLFDAVRGATKFVSSNDTASEYTQADSLSAFTSDGFTVSDNTSGADMNSSSHTYVTWNWKANGSGSSNSDGSISSTVSANQTAGFSIQTWAGNGAYTTVGHGLGVAPELIFYFARTFPSAIWGDRYVWTTAIDGTDDYLRLDTTGVKGNLDPSISGSPTTTTIPSWQYPSGSTLVTYAFASKENFCKIGSYTGNGSADGPMIVTGFRPAWLLVKRTDATNNWVIYDVKRNTFNAIDKTIYTDTAAAEGSYSGGDILSNGFKIRYTGGMLNTNGGTYLYMAFAESPFKYANAR